MGKDEEQASVVSYINYMQGSGQNLTTFLILWTTKDMFLVYLELIVTAQPQPQPNSTSTPVGSDYIMLWTTPPHHPMKIHVVVVQLTK